MAESGKINAVDLANIAKLDAVDAANIAKVNGLVFSSAAFLLDTYTGATAGYSVRRLATSATNLMRIREDAGDTETDIGYDSNNELDTAAIATHCGTANGYVVTWYDQAGSNNATQGTDTLQPQIYNGSAVLTENGQPAVKFLSNSLIVPDAVWDKDDISVFTVCQATNTDSAVVHLSPDFAADWAILCVGSSQTSGNFGSVLYTNATLRDKDTGSYTLGTQILSTTISEVSTQVVEQYLDATAVSGNENISAAVDEMALGSRRDTSAEKALNGTIQEVIVYGDAKDSTGKSGIESDVNTYFSIY